MFNKILKFWPRLKIKPIVFKCAWHCEIVKFPQIDSKQIHMTRKLLTTNCCKISSHQNRVHGERMKRKEKFAFK